jgi:hypothetical protein
MAQTRRMGMQHQFREQAKRAEAFALPVLWTFRPAVYLPSILLGIEFPQYPSRYVDAHGLKPELRSISPSDFGPLCGFTQA